MLDHLRIVPVRPSQLQVLSEYVEALYRHDEDYEAVKYIEEGLKSLFRHENLATAYFIQKGEERLGYIILTRYYSVEKGGLTLFIDEFYVENQFRRQGIGNFILEKIEEVAKQEGAKTLWAQAESHNDAAIDFFMKNGFVTNTNRNFERTIG